MVKWTVYSLKCGKPGMKSIDDVTETYEHERETGFFIRHAGLDFDN